MNHPQSYSVAVIADIHGNVAALNAVLENLRNRPYSGGRWRLGGTGDIPAMLRCKTMQCTLDLRVTRLLKTSRISS